MRSGRVESSSLVKLRAREAQERGRSAMGSRRARTEAKDGATDLNRGGNSLPLGIFPSGSLSSSKNVWHMASYADSRSPGVYSSSFEIRSMALGSVRGRKTFEKG
jgi:hypothetical protein